VSYRQLPLAMALREESTFASWVGAAGPQLKSVLCEGGIILVIGAACSGRTHLLQAACADARARGESAIYVAGPRSLEPVMLDDLGELHTVCLDDMDVVAGHPQWEERLFHLTNLSRDRGHVLVLAGPLRFRLPDLASRVDAALVVQVDNLDDYAKAQVLTARARRFGYTLGDDAVRYLLRRHARDLASLLEVVGRLEALSLERQQTVSLALLRQALAESAS
jgi:DnaA family protein